MAPDAPPAELYDFLYRDYSRLSSYYAQIFRGKLASLEETYTDKESEIKAAQVSVAVAKGDLEHSAEISTTSKRVIDPHDVVTADVLTFLRESGRISKDVAGAAHGELIVAHGTLLLADRYMLKLADVAFEALINEEQAKTKRLRDQNQVNMLKLIRRFMSDLPLPSAFNLATDAGLQINGAIKEDGMEDLISGYYFKYGEFGLQDVSLVGIKETTDFTPVVPNTPLFQTASMAVKNLSEVLFATSSIRVTPLVFFRKLAGGPIDAKAKKK